MGQAKKLPFNGLKIYKKPSSGAAAATAAACTAAGKGLDPRSGPGGRNTPGPAAPTRTGPKKGPKGANGPSAAGHR